MSGGMPAGRVAQNAKSDVIVNDLPSAFIDRTGSRHSYGAGPMAVHVARNALHQETRRDLYSGNAGDPQLGYDGAHRLVQLKRTKVNGEHWQAEYAYDPLSRRIRKQVQYTDAHGQQHPAITTCYGWDGDQQSAEAMQDPEGEWHIRTTLYEPGSFVPLLRMDQSHPIQDPMLLELKRQQAEAGEPLPDALREALAEEAGECRYASYHTDHLGTPLALTDERGQTLWEASPDDWAAVSNQQGDTDQPLRFQGQYEDEESGLYYNRHRYYDPRLGRYVNQDPIGLLGGMNNYKYPLTPTQKVDALGLLSSNAQPKVNVPDTGDVVREFITNSRTTRTATLGDNAVYHSCSNNARIEECMTRLDEYESALGLDKSIGKHPVVQGFVELGREAGKEQVCMAINVCDIRGYKFDEVPDVVPPKLEDIIPSI